MSLKQEFETKTHTVTEKVLVKEIRLCDVCGKEIKNGNSYWELSTHHHDWGNDSCESYEGFDICSKGCLRVKFEEYLERSKGDCNTECFEVEKTL